MQPGDRIIIKESFLRKSVYILIGVAIALVGIVLVGKPSNKVDWIFILVFCVAGLAVSVIITRMILARSAVLEITFEGLTVNGKFRSWKSIREIHFIFHAVIFGGPQHDSYSISLLGETEAERIDVDISSLNLSEHQVMRIIREAAPQHIVIEEKTVAQVKTPFGPNDFH